jgi:hypothetical protein
VSGIIFFSLVINLVCFYFIYLLWKKIAEIKVNKEPTENIEELLELFSQEMRHENDRLHKLISDFSSKYEHDNSKSEKPIETGSEAIKTIAIEEINLEEKNDDEHVDSEINSATNQVILLAKQGYNAQQIAKMLNRGKGEIELLLKFYG